MCHTLQAIQHHLAAMAGETAASGAAVDAAARAETGYAFEAAKARTSQAAGEVARLAHQVHGAIGFTEEHRLHHWTKRLWAWRDEFGNESHWSTHGTTLTLRGDNGSQETIFKGFHVHVSLVRFHHHDCFTSRNGVALGLEP